MAEILSENAVLDQLNQQVKVKDLLVVAIKIISQSIDHIMINSFNQESHAKKFVIPSLLERNGPLSNLSVKLKLLYALGNITREEYEDIELLIAILDELNDDKKTYKYTDDEILGPVSLLYDLILPPSLPTKELTHQSIGIVDSMKSSIYASRYEQVIRSALIISITTLIMRITQR